MNKEINNISTLLDDYYKINDYQTIFEEETFGHKKENILLANTLLNNKRKRDNQEISKNLFSYMRGK